MDTLRQKPLLRCHCWHGSCKEYSNHGPDEECQQCVPPHLSPRVAQCNLLHFVKCFAWSVMLSFLQPSSSYVVLRMYPSVTHHVPRFV